MMVSLSFDKTSSVYLTGTNHEENQPVHLQIKRSRIFQLITL